MVRNIPDLREHLFDTLEMLKKGEMKPETAKAIVNVSQVIVDSAKVEVELIKHVGGFGTKSAFIPVEDSEETKKLDRIENNKSKVVTNIKH